jgi:uncharacterized protein (DUF1501 family)
MDITRRKFLKVSVGAAGTFLASPHFLPAAAIAASLPPRRPGKDKILVLVQLSGGCDGINTVIPYGTGAYYQYRPTLALKPEHVHPLNGQIGLHKNMTALSQLYKAGKLAVVLGVGYPEPSRSHFRSIEVWQTAEPDRILDTGWISRSALPSMPDPSQLQPFNDHKGGNSANKIAYPDNSFAMGLRSIARMISMGVGARVYNLSLEGFDTHANQNLILPNLLSQLSDGLSAFQADLQENGVDRDVVLMTFSEFGRRVRENGAFGTDHGTAAPLFVMGSSVKGGIYGDYPSLVKLDQGDLKHSIDFRTVYATLLDRWLGADSQEVLGGQFDCLAFL